MCAGAWSGCASSRRAPTCSRRAASSKRRRSTSTYSSAMPTCSADAIWSTMGARRGRKSRTRTRATSRRSRPQKKRRSAMTRIRSLASAALLGASALLAVAPIRAEEPQPDQLVKNVTLEVVELITKDKEIQAGDRAKLIQLIDAKVLPHFNFTAMTALALGQSWNKATPEQKKRLTEEFRTLLVRTYASALAAYSEQKLEFRPLRAKPTDTDVTVQVRVLQPGAQPVPIDYSMEKTAGGWKVYDVMVGGVSLVANYRTEFANVVRESGIDGLIKSLQTKNRSLEGAGLEKK